MKKKAIWTVVVILFAVGLLLGAIFVRAQTQAGGPRIGFLYLEAGRWELAIVSPVGGSRAPLFTAYAPPEVIGFVDQWLPPLPGDILAPSMIQELAWTGNGSLLAFVSRDGLFDCEAFGRVDLETRAYHTVRCVPGDVRSEAIDWSPDGSRLAFAARENQVTSLRVVDPEGDVLEHFAIGATVWGLAWSPDSTRLAATVAEARSLYIYLDGQVERYRPEAPALGKPAWSPDGHHLAFLCGIAGERIEICTMAVDGSEGNRLSFPADFPHIKADLQWSPDGAWLAFVAVQPGGFNDIFLISPQGGRPVQLTFDPAGDSSPTWSPDGLQLAFTSNRGGNWDLYRIGVDGLGLTRLTDSPGDELGPVWRPSLTKQPVNE